MLSYRRKGDSSLHNSVHCGINVWSVHKARHAQIHDFVIPTTGKHFDGYCLCAWKEQSEFEYDSCPSPQVCTIRLQWRQEALQRTPYKVTTCNWRTVIRSVAAGAGGRNCCCSDKLSPHGSNNLATAPTKSKVITILERVRLRLANLVQFNWLSSDQLYLLNPRRFWSQRNWLSVFVMHSLFF